jgi:hypothetical protein
VSPNPEHDKGPGRSHRQAPAREGTIAEVGTGAAVSGGGMWCARRRPVPCTVLNASYGRRSCGRICRSAHLRQKAVRPGLAKDSPARHASTRARVGARAVLEQAEELGQVLEKLGKQTGEGP